jgi:osmotically-inducible protein OsmY
MMDTPLFHEVTSALERNPYLSGNELDFEASQGRVTLRGTVPSFFQKQMAQESIRTLDGVHEIQNELQVHTDQFGWMTSEKAM